MSVEADPTNSSINHSVPSSAPIISATDSSESSAVRQDSLQESEELRRRRRRRRRTVADLPPAQKRFRLILLGAVIVALVVAATGGGKVIRATLHNISRAINGAIPLSALKQFARPELILLVIAVFIMIILIFPDVEDKVLVTLGFRKAKRPHRTRSSRRHRSDD